MTVRREKVILELDDQTTPGLLRVAAGARAADAAIDDLGGTARITSRETDRLGTATRKTGRDLDDLERRARGAARATSPLVDSIVALTPALTGVAALAVPTFAGMSAQIGFAAAASSAAIVAFTGMSDALKALDAYRDDPTAANFVAMRQELNKLGPDAQRFVAYLHDLEPTLKSIRQTAQGGILPGAEAGIDRLLTRLPQIREIVAEVSDVTGSILEDAGAGLAGEKYDEFFDYLHNEARPILTDTAATVGHLTTMLANLFVATAPEQEAFAGRLRSATADLEDWARNLDETDGYQEFLDYLSENGPRVAEAAGAIANAVLQIAEATAPLTGPTLQGLTALANIIASIADSPVGAPLVALAAGLALVNRALAVRDIARTSPLANLIAGRTDFIERSRGSIRGLSGDLKTANAGLVTAQARQSAAARSAVLAQNALIPTAQKRAAVRDYQDAQRGVAAASLQVARAEQAQAASRRQMLASVGKGAAVVAGLGVATSGLADKIGLSHTASLSLIGTVGGPWGVALGAAAGATMDLAAANNDLETTTSRAARALGSNVTSLAELKRARDQLKSSVDDASFFTRYLNPFSAGDFGDAETRLRQTEREIATRSRRLTQRANAGSSLAAQGFDTLGIRQTASAFELATDAADEFRDSVSSINAVLSGQTSFTSYKASILDARDALKENGRTLDLNTRAGIANKQSLLQLAGAAVQAAEAMKDPVKQQGFLGGARKEFVDLATGMGMPKREAQALATELGLLNRIRVAPEVKLQVSRAQQQLAEFLRGLGLAERDVTTLLRLASSGAKGELKAYLNRLNLAPAVKKTLLQALTGAAKGDVRALISLIGNLRDKTVTITTRRTNIVENRTVGGQAALNRLLAVPNARGGLYENGVRRFDSGGMWSDDRANAHQPKRYAPSPVYRVFAEPETGGEVYLPLANDGRRGRSKSLLEETARRFGGQVSWNAYGSLTPGKDDADYQVSLLQAGSEVQQLKNELAAKRKNARGQLVSALTPYMQTVKKAELAAAQYNLAEIKAQRAADLAAPGLALSGLGGGGASPLLSRGYSAGAVQGSASRLLADVSAYGQVISQLRNAGASPGLLRQVVGQAESGDYRGALRMGRALLAQPDAIRGINDTLAEIARVSSSVATYTGSAAFASGQGALAGPAAARDVYVKVLIDPTADPTEWLQQIRRTTEHTLNTTLPDAWAGA